MMPRFLQNRSVYFAVPTATVLLVAAAVGVARPTAPPEAAPAALPAVSARGVEIDTLFLGGYARGSYGEALQTLAAELQPAERAMLGRHLEKIFSGVVEQEGLGRAGRLRVAFERAISPGGSARSVRVLAAEAAVSGELHSAFYYEASGKPGYFDHFGRTLDPSAWAGPLPELQVTSPYGKRRMHPVLQRVLPHTGVDYRAAQGAPVRATGDGVVSAAGRRGGYGNLVEIQHPSGYSTRYAHLQRIGEGVAPGRLVEQGDLIGYVGATGLATGPHLHYEVRRHGRAVDPQRLTSTTGVSGGLGTDASWGAERRRLTTLLARAPRY